MSASAWLWGLAAISGAASLAYFGKRDAPIAHSETCFDVSFEGDSVDLSVDALAVLTIKVGAISLSAIEGASVIVDDIDGRAIARGEAVRLALSELGLSGNVSLDCVSTPSDGRGAFEGPRAKAASAHVILRHASTPAR